MAIPGPDTLRQLEELWKLAPPGVPVRTFTQPVASSLVGTTGPDDASGRAGAALGDALSIYRAALALKALAGEVDVLLHAIGITVALPYVLTRGERVVSVSVDHDGAGTAGAAGLGVGDLVTTHQIAEFTFIRWHPTKGNGAREVKLLRDLIKLDLLDDSLAAGRRRVLYVTGSKPVERFLAGRTTIEKKLGRGADVLAKFKEHYGDEFPRLGSYWTHLAGRVELVDLHALSPDLIGAPPAD
jgi:hypothetical protein